MKNGLDEQVLWMMKDSDEEWGGDEMKHVVVEGDEEGVWAKKVVGMKKVRMKKG